MQVEFIDQSGTAVPRDNVSSLKAPARLKAMDREVAFTQFHNWCKARRLEPLVTTDTYRGFEEHVRANFAAQTGSRKLRYLYEIAIASADLRVRDYFFENFSDFRSADEVLSAPWWPPEARFLTRNLCISDKARVLRELDNCFRWQQRSATVIPSEKSRSLFLKEGMCEKTVYRRLSRLCVGLEAVLPGCPDLPYLRRWQRELHGAVWAPHSKTSLGPRRIPVIEGLLDEHGRMAESTRDGYRKALCLHHNLLAAAGVAFALDEEALTVFADHVWSQLGIVDDHTQTHGSLLPHKAWADATGWSMCEKLTPFIPDAEVRNQWQDVVRYLKRRAAKRGEIKRKEQALSERPMNLEMLFRISCELCAQADSEIRIQVRHGIHTVIAALGVLLFYPLRRADLLRLRIGQELKLHSGRWLLAPEFAQKSGNFVEPVILPEEAGFLIEFALLRGGPRAHLSRVYQESLGEPLLVSPRGRKPYGEASFSNLFIRHVGHRPHLIRSIWCDELVERGADRLTISIMLQHTSMISQEHYEVLASKIRRVRAVNKLHAIAQAVTSNANNPVGKQRDQRH